MHRFYVSQKLTSDTAAISDPDQLHHLKDVLRLKTGDEVVIFDVEGNEFTGTICAIDKLQASLRLSAGRAAQSGIMRLTLACAIPKKDRMDDIIDKLTQLGVDRIIPLETERVIVKLDSHKRDERLKRWHSIALNAAQQSQRQLLPQVDPVTRIEELLATSSKYDLKLIPTLTGERRLLREVLTRSTAGNILVLIGPEGDFSPGETIMAAESGFQPVSLGSLVLRVETAAIAVASYIYLELK